MLKDHAIILAARLTVIFNSSLREGVIPNEWKMANVIPLPKTKPIISVETDIRPISLTPIVAKVFESIVLGWVDDIVGERIDDNQFGGVGGTSTTDALVAMTHKWYVATYVLNNYVRVVLLDFSKAFDLINHHILVDTLITNGVPAHIVRWLAAFLLDRQQKVKIGIYIFPYYTLKTEVLKITLETSFLTLPKSARRDNTRSVTQTPREVSRS